VKTAVWWVTAVGITNGEMYVAEVNGQQNILFCSGRYNASLQAVMYEGHTTGRHECAGGETMVQVCEVWQ
jgi:hypothetical protein